MTADFDVMDIRTFLLLVGLGYTLVGCSSEDPVMPPVVTPPPTSDPPTVQLPEVTDCGYQASSDDVAGWNLDFEELFDDNWSDSWTAWQSGAFNNELQHYQSKNLHLSDGYLFIQSKKEQVTGRKDPFDSTQKSFSYTSGRIESKREFGPSVAKREVRFAARLRLVEGDGLWPAWWSYNDPWPTKGEIDILEARGNTPYEFQSNFHYGRNVNQIETDPVFNDFVYEHDEKLSTCFHVYELVWRQDAFEILFDGEIVKTYDGLTYTYVKDFFNKSHRLTLNLAVGGFFFTDLDVSKIPDEAFLVVDWVRVYSK